METEIHTQGTNIERQTGWKMKIQEGSEEMDKTKGDGLTDTPRREGRDLGRIREMGVQTDRKCEVGAPPPALIPHPHPTPSKFRCRGLWLPGLHLPLRGRGSSSSGGGTERL